MPDRLFTRTLPPQRIRTFLVLFAVVLTLPLLFLAALAFQQTAGFEERELQGRVLQVAQSLAAAQQQAMHQASRAEMFGADAPGQAYTRQ